MCRAPDAREEEAFLVTSALPYANGPIHLGHMMEYVQTDIYVRYLRSAGHDVIFVCADDTHGTPVELNAAKQGVTPEAFVAEVWDDAPARTSRDFGISLDVFHSTNSPENQHYSELIYGRLKDAGDILRRPVRQTYCEVDRRFLPDRFVRGTCPNCKCPDQYGDVCEVCGKTYRPEELIDPRCAICGTPPVTRESEHLFFALSRHQGFLADAGAEPGLPPPRRRPTSSRPSSTRDCKTGTSAATPRTSASPSPGRRTSSSTSGSTRPSATSRRPRSGRRTPGKARSALDLWAEDCRRRDPPLHRQGHRLLPRPVLAGGAQGRAASSGPARLHVHGHLTLNGEKMSKSRGTLITARTALEAFDPTYLRYFYAANLGPGPEDFDLSLPEFRARVNGELVNNVGNLANRTLSLLTGPLGGKLAAGAGGGGAAAARGRAGPHPGGGGGVRGARLPLGGADDGRGLAVGQPVPPGARALGAG